MDKIIVKIVEDNKELFKWYPNQSKQQEIFVELDCKKRQLSVNYNPEIGFGVPFAVWKKHVLRFNLPCSGIPKIKNINELLNVLKPLALCVINGYENVWDGNNCVAKYSENSQMSFKILSQLPSSKKGGKWLIQIRGDSLNEFFKEFMQEFSKYKISKLHQTQKYLLISIQFEKPWFLQNFINKNLIINYPILVENGQVRIELVAERIKVDYLCSHFNQSNIIYEIEEMGKYKRLDLLTEKQNNLLKSALMHGYFEIPRRISLTNLAKLNQIAPASLSEMLRRAYKRLANNYYGF